jgi:GT2 family glycosyltransferase
MQVFVLGMHRSGTSTVARLLNMMGCYFGPEGIALEVADDNQKGFWERKDVKEINDYVLKENGANWFNTSSFDINAISDSSREHFLKRAKSILNGMDAYRPWMVKDPRFCLTFSLWRTILERPVCVQVFRNPYEVALSLKSRNNFPILFSLALWQRYQKEALQSSIGLPNILLDYNKLLSSPVEVTRTLFEELKRQQLRGINMPAEDEITSFIDKELHHQQAPAHFADKLNKHQRSLYEKLKTGEVLVNPIWNDIYDEEDIDQLKIFDENIKLKLEKEALQLRLESLEAESQKSKNALEEQGRELSKKDQQIQKMNVELEVLATSKLQPVLELGDEYKDRLERLYEMMRAYSEEQTSGKKEIINSLLRQRDEQEAQLKILSEKLIDLGGDFVKQSNNIQLLLEERETLEKALKDQKEKPQSTEQELAFSLQLSQTRINLLEDRLANYMRQLLDYYSQLEEFERSIRLQYQESLNWQLELQGKVRAVEKLLYNDANALKELNQLHAANLNSWRWKVGNGLIGLIERMLLRKKVPLAIGRMSSILDNTAAQSHRLPKEMAALHQMLDRRKKLVVPEGYSEILGRMQDLLRQANPEQVMLTKARPAERSQIKVSLDNIDKNLNFSNVSSIEKKLNITLISPSTNIHGGTKRLLMIANLLHLRGHQVNFIRQYPSRELDWFDLGVPVMDVFFNEETDVSEIEKLLPDADVLITYGNNRANLVLNELSPRKGRKFQLFMHFGIHDEELDIQNAKLDNFQLLCTTNWIGDQLALYAKSKPQRIDFGIHNDQFYPTRSTRPLRMGALYHHSEWKRTSDVIHAYQMILADSEFTNLKLILYGQEVDPDLQGVDCEYIYDPSQNEIREIYSSCAVWITPSLFEGIGMCSVEAMLCKTPLITVDTGGSRDFCDSNNSVIIEKESPQAIKDAVIQVLRNPIESSTMAEIAYHDISKHSWTNSIDLLEKAIGRESLPVSDDTPSSSSSDHTPLLSIGIPIHNQLDYIKACLKSIRENTHSPYEIILVDDCSDEETHQYLSAQSGSDTVYIRNTQQRGFPYNCNTILLYAKGRFVCLLNSDTVVTKNWDKILIEVLIQQPGLAMVGPSTSYGVAKNYDKVAQQLDEVHFHRFEMSYEDIQEFARSNYQQEGSKWQVSEYINGFCMMLRADVVAKVGFFDTAFGLGSREEVQYVDRLREEGYEVGWVKGAYVHHYGHRSFSTIEDSKQLWEKNKALYFSKKGQVNHLGITKKRIAFVYNAEHSSSTRKRTFEPVQYLDRFLTVKSIHWRDFGEELFDLFEIIVLQRIGGLNEEIPDNFRQQLFGWIKKYKRSHIFIFDIDDLVIHAQNDLPVSLIKHCCYVSTSTPQLAQTLQMYNSKTHVLPNGIDRVRFEQIAGKKFEGNKTRVICFTLAGAGVEAYNEIARLVNNAEPEKFEFHLFAGERIEADKFPYISIHKNLPLDELFAWLKSVDYVINWDRHSEAYFTKLRAQYGLLEEEQEAFVDGKSGLKYYNAAIARCVFISTPRPTEYQRIVQDGKTGFLVDSPEEAKNIILALEADHQRKERILQSAYEHVLTEYALENTVRHYLDFFSTV